MLHVLPMHIKFHPKAAEEIVAACNWYDQRMTGLGENLSQEIDRSLNVVKRAPQTWPVFGESSRRFLLRRFPFALIYQERENEILILCLMHLRRKPFYWKKRV